MHCRVEQANDFIRSPIPTWASLICLPFSCAGVCQYYPNSGLVTVRLGEPLLKVEAAGNLIREHYW